MIQSERVDNKYILLLVLDRFPDLLSTMYKTGIVDNKFLSYYISLDNKKVDIILNFPKSFFIDNTKYINTLESFKLTWFDYKIDSFILDVLMGKMRY